MRLGKDEKESLILNLLEAKGMPLTAREIAESIYGKGQHQSIVFSKLEEMVSTQKLSKVGARQPFSYGIPISVAAIPIRSTPELVSRHFDPSNIMLDSNVLLEKANKYYSSIRNDSHARYLSWEHCYSYFHENHIATTSKTRNFACLHLAWYLASWGMLRNSFLMQKDYLIHMGVIELIFSREFSSLLSTPIDGYINNPEDYINKVFALAERIRDVYTPFAQEYKAEITDTLVTKVLLGTLGCVPAYDRFFKDGLRITEIASSSFTKESLRSLINYYNLNYVLFGKISFKINQKMNYPPMKIIDMCFWQIGYESSQN